MHDRLTKSDIEKMQKEIDERRVAHQDLLQAVREARALGDLSENFEYYAAKREKNMNESRIRYLENMIKTAEIIEDTAKEDEIGLNKVVELFAEDDEEMMTVTLVTTILSDSLKGRISIESPLGKAIRGHKVGDRVFVEIRPGTGYYVQIRSITECTEELPIQKY